MIKAKKGPIRVFVVDDDEEDYFLFREMLNDINGETFTSDWAPSYEIAKVEILKQVHDVYFIDYRLGLKTGLELIQTLILEGCSKPMILLTGYGDHAVDREAMIAGAADYAAKDQMNSLLLERSIRYAIYRSDTLKALKDREAQILMQDRLASVGLLASSLAHEIGTPLGVIRGRAEYIMMQVGNDEKIKKNVDVIIGQIDRVSRLIRSLLNLARGDQLELERRVNLKKVTEEVLELLAHEWKKHGIEIRNEIDESVLLAVKAQAEPLHQVLLNLFVNSIHAIETAKKSGRHSNHFVRLWVEDAESSWKLNIEDSGCGISEKNIGKLFQPFFTTKEVGQGTGLGLATSYRILESWGGSIKVESVPDVSTHFILFLPKATPC